MVDQVKPLNRYAPSITFIIVQKRHHTRFFAKDQCDRTARIENVENVVEFQSCMFCIERACGLVCPAQGRYGSLGESLAGNGC